MKAISMKTVLIADTTLFHVAAAHLGDATRWDEIARLNAILDPLVVGIRQIRVPTKSDPVESAHASQ
jgi:hypothetical protein